MAQDGAASGKSAGLSVLTSTLLYYAMMVMIGGTIGAIAGLSQTSVTNTLLQLIVPVAAGSVGLYFIDRKSQREGVETLRRVGLLGVLFMATFWIVWYLATMHRYHGAHFEWNHEITLYENVTRAEIYGHAGKLGIADEDIRMALDKHRTEVSSAKTPSSAGAQHCDLLREDAKTLSDVASRAYRGVMKGSDDNQLKAQAKYFRERFSSVAERLHDDAPSAATAGERMRDQAVASLLLLTVKYPRLAKPASIACSNGAKDGQNAEEECSAAERMERMVATCPDVWLVDALATMRAHAGKFGAIWGEAVSSELPTRKNVFESRD